LLTPWTYQAMVHELLGIKNNRVDLKGVPGIKKDLSEIVLSAEQDPWFKQTMYLNFGDLGVKIKDLVDDYQVKTKSNQNIETIEDIKRFVESYPEFRKLSGNVTKHVTLMGELSRIVETRALLDTSELEQDLANQSNHSEHVKKVRAYLDDPRFSKTDKLRIVLMYALRYETNTSNEVPAFVEKLFQNGLEKESISTVTAMLKYAGAPQRSGTLFSGGLFKVFKKKLDRGIKGVENIYTEHKPMLKETLESILTNKLNPTEYPYAPGTKVAPQSKPPQDIIVFFIGGLTFEEALIVHEFNVSNTGVRIIIGGTHVLNSAIFLKDVSAGDKVSLA